MSGTGEVVPKRKPKQAIVVVHGMGEQRTMATLRDFVAAMCNVSAVTAQRTKEPFHIIPDTASGMSDLARIRISNPPRGNKDLRTDFYEFYYADLLGGTTLSHLQSWAQGLMFRWPHQVPRGLAGLWITLWAVALFVAWWIGQEFDGDVVKRFTDLVTSGLKAQAAQPTLLQTLILMFCMSALAYRLLLMAIAHVESRETAPNSTRTHLPFWSYALSVVLPLGLFWALWNVLPWEKLSWTPSPACGQSTLPYICLAADLMSQVWIKLLVAAAVWWSITRFGVAYFGDVARYLRMSPDAIQSREAIRARGVALLTALQSKRSVRDGKPSESPEYDRIVVVAHSLGSVIAYDVLRILWARDNANSNTALPPVAVEAMKEIVNLQGEELGRSALGQKRTDFQTGHFIELQQKVSRSLRDEPAGWRISDFITLGSPLARADFLLARDWPRFAQAVGERSFPICPPFLEKASDTDRGSFLYTGGSIPGCVPHHAAMFSAIRWTAIFDPYRYPMNGDFIGGPVAPLFGAGITDVAVRISRRRWWLPELFTHTEYWNPDVKASVANPDTLPPDLSKGDSSGDTGLHSKEQETLVLLRNLIWPAGSSSASD